MISFSWQQSVFSDRTDYKISIAGGLLVIGLTLAAGIMVYSLMQPQIESALSRGIEIALKSHVTFFKSQVEEGLADSYAIATRPFLVQALQKLNEDTDNASALRDLRQEIDSLLLAGFTAANVYHTNGKKLLQEENHAQNHTDKFPMHVYPNSFLTWGNNQFILHVKQDLLDTKERRIGSITTEKKLPKLTRNFTRISEIGESVELMLCEPLEMEGQEMACLLSKVDGVEFKRLPREVNGAATPISYALDGKSGVITTKAYHQVPAIASYSPIGTFGMLLMQDKEEIYGPIIDRVRIIAVCLVLLIIIGILLLAWLVMPLMRRLARSEKSAKERLKECQCLHGIRRDMEHELQEKEFCQKVITRLTQAMQFPEITSVMIKLGDKQFSSDGYDKDAMHKLQARILVRGEAYGWLNVVYSEEQPFWLPEEQDLIDTVASVLGRWIEQQQAKQRIIMMATHDGLTGLPNRYLLQDRIKQVLAHDRRAHEQAAVLFIDLDRFKNINDTLGHAMGDLLLKEVAARLNAIVRTEDTVARHGGDEFIILLQNVSSSQEVKAVAQKILNALIQPFHLQGRALHIGGSIGIAMFPSDGDDVEALLRSSDIAMYHAKNSGRNNYQFFSPEMNPKMTEKGSVELEQ